VGKEIEGLDWETRWITLLSGGEGDGGVGLGDTLDVRVVYWAVQNEARGEEDDDGELVTVVCFVYFCFVLNNFLSGRKSIYSVSANFFFLHGY
jgi:hypothetical protein